MSAMDSDSKTNNAAHAGRILRLIAPLWRKTGKAWTDFYHPLTVQLRDHSKHSKKQKR
jgi:hypothetical protein